MTIAVLSGKGGTGKTLVSTSLAAVADKALYLDCDVEEPNGHLFLKPETIRTHDITVKVPEVDHSKCTGCRTCVDFCKYNAMAYVGGEIKIFGEICHSCGGCSLVCPTGAISEVDKVVGKIESGESENVSIHSGFMNTGEASGIPIIKGLLAIGNKAEENVIIDCPPGSACIVMESIKDVDFCVLVAEPTVFGVHNLTMVHDLVKLFKKPHGVILNKCTDDFNPAEAYCKENNVPIIGRIPYDNKLGQINGEGGIVVREMASYRTIFKEILDGITKEVEHETIVNP